MNPKHFAREFDIEFARVTAGLSSKEIPLFRALQRTLQGMSNRFQIEEYHGAKHQVKFSGTGSWSRPIARCELSDLFIVVYSRNPLSIRITFFQAKSERNTKGTRCLLGETFSANLEQWDLLAHRPSISGCGSFNPPANLLTSAILPSIGTFGFFYKNNPHGKYKIFYSTADNLCLDSPVSKRYGKLFSKQRCRLRSINGFTEKISSCSNTQFAYHLVSNHIGSPIHHHSDASMSGNNNPFTRSWLANVLKESIS